MNRINYYARTQHSNFSGTFFRLTLSLLLLVPGLCQASFFGVGEAYPQEQGHQQDFASTETGEGDFLSTVPETKQGTPGSSGDQRTGSTIEYEGVEMQFSSSVSTDGTTEIRLDGSDGSFLSVDLDDFGFRVENNVGGVSLQHDWSRPRGDMMALLESHAGTASYTDAGSAFDAMPLFYAAMDHAVAVMHPAQSQQLDLVWIASNLVSRWLGDADHLEPQEMVIIEEEPVPTDPIKECNFHDFALPVSGKITVDFPGIHVEVIAAESNLNADCVTDNCISGKSSVARTIRATEEDGKGCPGYGSWWDSDYALVAEIDFHADAGTGHCTNGVPDTARSGTILASGSGFNGKVNAASDTGNGLSARAGINGEVKVCFDDDLIFDDITDLIVTGEATAEVD